MTKEFSFIESYRTLLPNSGRDEVILREKGFAKYVAKDHSTAERQKLCRLVFGLPEKHENEFEDFQKTFQEDDSTFLVHRDRAESSRLAGLLLRARIQSEAETIPLMLLTAAVANLRSPISNDNSLLVAARDQLIALGNERTRNQLLQLSPQRSESNFDLSAQLNAMMAAINPSTVVPAFEILREKTVSALSDLAGTEGQLLVAVRRETAIQQENLDALWACITGWTRSLDRPRSKVNTDSQPLVIGIDAGDSARIPPGAYSTGAVLQKLLGANCDKKITISATVTGIEQADRQILTSTISTKSQCDLCPIHHALVLATSGDGKGWESEFKRDTGLDAHSVLSAFDLAVQTFRERVLLNLVYPSK